MEKQNILSCFDEYHQGETKITYNAVSVRGDRHQRNNEFNQDYFLCNVKNDIKYVIVADGLGSAKNSHEGSKRAVEILEQMIGENLDQDAPLSKAEIEDFNQRLLHQWKSSFPNDTREYDTTLLYCILLSHGFLVGGVGDGLLLCSRNNQVVSIKENHRTFSNQTYSLASVNALDFFEASYTPLKNDELPCVFILATDGVSDDLKPDLLESLPSFLHEELSGNGVEEMQEILTDWMVNWQTQNHSDDRTFCVLTIWKAGENQ